METMEIDRLEEREETPTQTMAGEEGAAFGPAPTAVSAASGGGDGVWRPLGRCSSPDVGASRWTPVGVCGPLASGRRSRRGRLHHLQICRQQPNRKLSHTKKKLSRLWNSVVPVGQNRGGKSPENILV